MPTEDDTLARQVEELTVLQKCVRALEPLDPPGRRRAVRYLSDRYKGTHDETDAAPPS